MTSTEAPDNRPRYNRTALFTWGPPLLMFLLIMALSLTPGSIYPEHPEIFNIGVHFLEYAFLAYFLARALTWSRAGTRLGILIWTFTLSGLVGVITELLQFTVPHRMFDTADMLVDIFGAFTGAFIYIRVVKMQKAGGPGKGDLPVNHDV